MQEMDIRVLPALERMANNDALHDRSLARFDRDDPPPYESSTDSSTHEHFFASSIRSYFDIPGAQKARMDEPLDDEEREMAATALCSSIQPMAIYRKSVKKEAERIDDHLIPRAKMWQDRMGQLRLGIVARHTVKKSWQELRVWNPVWGMPGRNKEPGDDALFWRWPWQPPQGPVPEAAGNALRRRDWSYEKQLARRAFDLRRGLRRGEHVPVIPQGHLPSDASAAQAEAFLISRPWFVFAVEVAEEAQRLHRVMDDIGAGRTVTYSPKLQVIAWWKERGDWRPDYMDDRSRQGGANGWKWRHESPEPEPEDRRFVAVDSMVDEPLDAHPDLIEFTPSEVDALEAAEAPEAEHPATFWRTSDDPTEHSYPGQWAPLPPKPKSSTVYRPMPSLFTLSFQNAPAQSADGDDGDDGDDTAELPAAAVHGASPSPASGSPAPRRSSRIAARKRAAEKAACEEHAPAKRQRQTARPVMRSEPKPRRQARATQGAQKPQAASKAKPQARMRTTMRTKTQPVREQTKSSRAANRRAVKNARR